MKTPDNKELQENTTENFRPIPPDYPDELPRDFIPTIIKGGVIAIVLIALFPPVANQFGEGRVRFRGWYFINDPWPSGASLHLPTFLAELVLIFAIIGLLIWYELYKQRKSKKDRKNSGL